MGRFLLSLGILLFALIAYLQWGTNLQQQRAQDDLRKRFADASATSVASTLPATSSTSLTTSPATSPAVASTPSVTTTAPPATTSPTSAAPTVAIREGDPVATIEIPRIGLHQVVVSGVSASDLRLGPGHFRDTPEPGQQGNVAIAGHRTTYGGPFGDLDRVTAGDQIVLTTLTKQRYVYVVTATSEVVPSDVSVLDKSSESLLTLVTCTPKLTAAKRLIVRGKLDAASSAPVTPAVVAPTTTVSSVTSVASPGSSGAAASTVAGATTTAPPEALPGEEPASKAGLVGGWNSDRGAWVQLILWGLACGAVAVGGWLVSRRTDRWIGAMVGLLPFVVTLWFFFENISRLLPPNL